MCVSFSFHISELISSNSTPRKSSRFFLLFSHCQLLYPGMPSVSTIARNYDSTNATIVHFFSKQRSHIYIYIFFLWPAEGNLCLYPLLCFFLIFLFILEVLRKALPAKGPLLPSCSNVCILFGFILSTHAVCNTTFDFIIKAFTDNSLHVHIGLLDTKKGKEIRMICDFLNCSYIRLILEFRHEILCVAGHGRANDFFFFFFYTISHCMISKNLKFLIFTVNFFWILKKHTTGHCTNEPEALRKLYQKF